MKRRNAIYRCLGTGFVGAGLLAAAPKMACADDWKFSAEIYALGADVGATTVLDGEYRADFDDILDNLEFAMFGSIVAKRDKLALIANLMYVDISSSQTNERRFTTTVVDVDMEALITTMAVGWEFVDTDTTVFHGLIGTRLLSLDTKVSLDIDPLGVRNGSESDEFWDLVFGIQGRTDFSDHWYLTYYADMGSGDSESTWQLSAALGYRFSHLDVAVGYQYLEWEFDDLLLEDLQMSGPALGLRFHW